MDEQCKFCCTKLENISVKFGQDVIVDNVNIHLHCGETTVIIGKNGAGKSTLLKAILGIVPHEGKITFASKHNKCQKLKMGYVPQLVKLENSPLSVYDMVCSYVSNIPTFIFKSKKKYEEIKTHLKEFGIEKLIDEKVSNLSGGQLQRVLIAIATMPYPELLILDEPVSGIDEDGRIQMYALIEHLTKKHDIAILMVSHDLNMVKHYADKVVLLNNKVIKTGTANEVYASEEFLKEFKGMR